MSSDIGDIQCSCVTLHLANSKIALIWVLKVKGKQQHINTEKDGGNREKPTWKMAENAPRDHIKWGKLLNGLMHQLGCEEWVKMYHLVMFHNSLFLACS